jgi:ATP-dependent DNA helicase RecG
MNTTIFRNHTLNLIRTYFLATLPIHNSLKERAQAGGQAEGQASKKALNDMERSILEVLAKGPSSRDDLLNSLGMDKRTGYFRRMIERLMDNDFIAYTYPDTPRHPDQKYEITDVGKQQIT